MKIEKELANRLTSAGENLEVVHPATVQKTKTKLNLHPLASFQGPTEAELFSLYTKDLDASVPTIPDESENYFASILNRGSSQE